MFNVPKQPKTTTPITSAMTWWLTKRRVFKVDKYEIALLDIDYDRQSVKILIKNTESGETSETEESLQEA
jgi:hypothetical protein